MRRSAEPTAGHVEEAWHVELRVGKIGDARWEKPMESASRFERSSLRLEREARVASWQDVSREGGGHGGRGPAMKGDHT